MDWNIGWLFFGAAAFVLVIVNLIRVCAGKAKGWQVLLLASLSCGAGGDFVGLSSGCKLGAARRSGRHTGCGPDDGGDLYGCPRNRDRAESACSGCAAAQESGVNCPGGAGKIPFLRSKRVLRAKIARAARGKSFFFSI